MILKADEARVARLRCAGGSAPLERSCGVVEAKEVLRLDVHASRRRLCVRQEHRETLAVGRLRLERLHDTTLAVQLRAALKASDHNLSAGHHRC